MVRLPFAEDARNLDERLQPAQGEDWPVASVEQIDAAKGLIGKLTRKNFWPDNFSNPGTLILIDLNIISFSPILLAKFKKHNVVGRSVLFFVSFHLYD